MESHVYIPFTVTALSAAVLAAAFNLAPTIAVAGDDCVTTPPAATAAKEPARKPQSLRQYVLKTGMVDGKMVYIDSEGKANPTLKADVGDTVEITVSSGEGAEHDIVIDELGVHSAHFNAKTGPTKVTFEVTEAGTFTYFCSIPGHRQIGMQGLLEVAGGAASIASSKTTAKLVQTAHTVGHIPSAKPAPLPAPKAEAVSIALSPAAVPAPLGKREPTLVKYRIETVELEGKLDDGTTFSYWTFNKKVPGPLLRVKEGDTVELTLVNAPDSKMIHSIDLHAVTGGHGGGEMQVAPGKEGTFRFKAMKPGLYVYHCATASVPHHISAGMYGMILVEPKEGLAEVDREFYVMQGDLYTTHAAGTKGHQEFSHERASDELPTYYTFNGAVGSLTKEHRMEAKVGETVRVFFGVGGPNKISSFHAIGEIFDRVYAEGSFSSVRQDVQTTLVAPGGATAVEFKLDYPGTFMLVDHALSRVGKGAAAALHVTGSADSAVYERVDFPADMADPGH